MFHCFKTVDDGLTADAAPSKISHVVKALSFDHPELCTFPCAEKIAVKKTHVYSKKVNQGLVLFLLPFSFVVTIFPTRWTISLGVEVARKSGCLK